MLSCRQISKSFDNRDVLRDVSYEFSPGGKYVLLGPSGSGKTTLLSIVGCMLSPTAGEVKICGQDVAFADKGQLCRIRRQRIGFVFQHAQLLPFLNVSDNLLVVCRNVGMSRRQAKNRAACVMDKLKISHLCHHRPAQCSGGERQRVAIARAILHRPAIILADEPTASLDWENGQQAVQLLTQLVDEEKSVLITVTHDTRLVPMFDSSLQINEGKVTEK